MGVVLLMSLLKRITKIALEVCKVDEIVCRRKIMLGITCHWDSFLQTTPNADQSEMKVNLNRNENTAVTKSEYNGIEM